MACDSTHQLTTAMVFLTQRPNDKPVTATSAVDLEENHVLSFFFISPSVKPRQSYEHKI